MRNFILHLRCAYNWFHTLHILLLSDDLPSPHEGWWGASFSASHSLHSTRQRFLLEVIARTLRPIASSHRDIEGPSITDIDAITANGHIRLLRFIYLIGYENRRSVLSMKCVPIYGTGSFPSFRLSTPPSLSPSPSPQLESLSITGKALLVNYRSYHPSTTIDHHRPLRCDIHSPCSSSRFPHLYISILYPPRIGGVLSTQTRRFYI